MILNIREFPEGQTRFTQECTLDSIKNDLPPMQDTLKCKGEVNRLGMDIYVHIWFQGNFILQCSRCLEDFNSPINGEVKITMKEVVGKHGKAEDDEAVDYYYDPSRDSIDISSAFYDEIMVEMPIMPLCSKECRGVEIQDKDITIEFSEKQKKEDEIDPRWEALRKLKDKI